MRCWRFRRSLPQLLGDAPFARFLAFADWLYARTGQTHALAHDRLVNLLHEFLVDRGDIGVEATLLADYRGAGGRSRLRFEDASTPVPPPRKRAIGTTPQRQARHL